MPRRLFDRLEALIDWTSNDRPCLTPLSRPPTLEPEEFRRFSDIPQYLISFYPKLGVPRALLPPPRTDTLVAAISTAVHTAETSQVPLGSPPHH